MSMWKVFPHRASLMAEMGSFNRGLGCYNFCLKFIQKVPIRYYRK